MDGESAGLIGALVGLGLGIVDYAILSRLFEKVRLQGKMQPEVERIIKLALAGGAFIAFPVVGYVIGRFVWA